MSKSDPETQAFHHRLATDAPLLSQVDAQGDHGLHSTTMSPAAAFLHKSEYVFSPDGTVTSIWSILMIVVTIYQVLTIPYLIAFEGSESYVSVYMDFSCFVFFVGDILMSFNTGFYVKGDLCCNRRLIVAKYARGWLVLDIASTFPYHWLLQSPFEQTTSNYRAPALIRVIKISRLLRTVRVLRLIKIGQHFIVLQQKLSNELSFLITFLSIITVMACIAHWAACGFYFMSQISDSQLNWVTAVEMENSSDSDKYIMALYWAVTTLTTTGFGDVVPVNSIERIYGITLMVLSAGVFSFLVGKIATVISNVEKSVNEHREVVLDISRYLKEANVPEDVRYRALRYVDYKWETRKNRKILDKKILSHFSEPLKNEISDEIFGTIIGRVPFISKFEHGFVSQLAQSVEPEIFAVMDTIFLEGEKSTDMYFLEKGKVELYHEFTKCQYAILTVRNKQSGQHFGEFAFITEAGRSASAKCIQYAEVLKLRRQSFMELIQLSPSATYTFQVVNDIIVSKNFFELGIFCYLCREFTHMAKECRQSRLQIHKDEIQRKWLTGGRKKSKRLRVTISEGPNFRRKYKRKVHIAQSYALRNVSAGPMSTPLFLRGKVQTTQSAPPLGSVVMISPDSQRMKRLDMIPTTERSLMDENGEGDDESPFFEGRAKRFSIFRGVKTYALKNSQGFITRGSIS